MPGYLAIIAGKDEFLVDQDGRACFEKAKKAAIEQVNQMPRPQFRVRRFWTDLRDPVIR